MKKCTIKNIGIDNPDWIGVFGHTWKLQLSILIMTVINWANRVVLVDLNAVDRKIVYNLHILSFDKIWSIITHQWSALSYIYIK